MLGTGSVTSWLLTLLVVIVTAAGLTAAGSLPATPRTRRLWMTGIIIFGLPAIAGTVWQGRKANDELPPLSGTTSSPEIPNRQRNGPTISDLTKQIKGLEGRIRELEVTRQARTIKPETAEKLAAHLRQFGTRRVVVSCIPDDFEAYQYANQVANVLRAANWDAHGPEVTKIFGDVRSIGVNFYINEAHQSETAKILFDSFAKFNIPYQSRVTPSQAIPDTETVELFIGAQPSQQVNSSAD